MEKDVFLGLIRIVTGDAWNFIFLKWKLDPNDAITKKNIIWNKDYTLQLNFLNISRNIVHDRQVMVPVQYS